MKLRLIAAALVAAVLFAVPAEGKDPFEGHRFTMGDINYQPIAYQIIYGGTLPTVCNPNTGDAFMLTAGVAGFHRCSAVNTWTRVISNNDPDQTWVIGTDEDWQLTTTTGWPAQFRHTAADGFAVSFQNATTGTTFNDGTILQLLAAGEFVIQNQENLNIVIGTNGATAWTFGADKSLLSDGVTFANLPAAPANGMIIYCSDCTKATPCAAAGTGALAVRLNGAWDCNP